MGRYFSSELPCQDQLKGIYKWFLLEMQIFFLNHFESRKNDIFSFWAGFTFLGFIVSLGFLNFRFSIRSKSKDHERLNWMIDEEDFCLIRMENWTEGICGTHPYFPGFCWQELLLAGGWIGKSWEPGLKKYLPGFFVEHPHSPRAWSCWSLPNWESSLSELNHVAGWHCSLLSY